MGGGVRTAKTGLKTSGLQNEFDTAKSTIEFAILAGCWSRQQHMAGAVTRSPWPAAAVAVWALLQKPQEVEVEVKGEQVSRSWVSRVLQ